MQFPSLTQLQKKTFATFKRFPLAIISAIIATVACIYLVEVNGQDEFFYLGKIAAVAVLGIPLFTIIPLIAEKKQWNFPVRGTAAFLGIIFLIGYYFFLPDKPVQGGPYIIYRYALYFIALHLLVAVGPYLGRNQTLEFWQYNKMLFLRILTAILFSGVLFAGLAAALGSVEFLFNADITAKRYWELFLVIAGIFNSWFFLAGIPEPIHKLDFASGYPKGLKVFARNVLLPLVIIYMIILYLYAGKIIIQWAWPEGGVSVLILFFSIFGILAILLLYPLGDKTDNRWVKRFSTSYYWILFPLTIFLILSIWRRISEYGFTVERYFVFVLGLWLLGLAIYFMFSKKQNIKVIPISLCIIAFAISAGPWGAFAVSRRSQVNRLQTILQENKLLQNGSIHRAAAPIPAYDAIQISSILRYLDRTRNLHHLQPWFNENLEQLTTDKKQWGHKDAKQITQLLGIEYYNYVNPERLDENPNTVNLKPRYFYTDFNKTIATQKIDWLIKDLSYSSSYDSTAYHLGKQLLIIEQSEQSPHLKIYVKSKKHQTININLEKIIDSLLLEVDGRRQELSAEKLAFGFSNQALYVKLYIGRIQWSWPKDTVDVESSYHMIGVSVK